MFKNSGILKKFLSEQTKLFDCEPKFLFRFNIETKTGHHFTFRFDLETKHCVLFRLVCIQACMFNISVYNGRKERNIGFL
jgi:hypothetical protein